MKKLEIQLSTNKKNINPKEVIALWTKVGWGKEGDYSISRTQKALVNTSYVLSVCNVENSLIGLARVFSDGVIHTSVAEVAVDPGFQRKGVGKLIMDRINRDFKGTAIYLESLPGKTDFFKKVGYTKRNKMQVFSRFSK